MNDIEQELALRCYGYGKWEAPYWQSESKPRGWVA